MPSLVSGCARRTWLATGSVLGFSVWNSSVPPSGPPIQGVAMSQTNVEVELGNGERLTLRSLSPEPGYGFLTLSVHAADGDAEEHIVPIGAIRRIALGPADESRRPGFALSKEIGPEPAA